MSFSPSYSSTKPNPSLSFASCAPTFIASESSPRRSRVTNSAYAKKIFDSRKSWKTSTRGEPVWPQFLEELLIEGLLEYRPDNSRATRQLGRFPLRNRYIADYIKKHSGHDRTPKQVGSRIQQLRDTAAGREMLNHLNDEYKRLAAEFDRQALLAQQGAALNDQPSDAASRSNSVKNEVVEDADAEGCQSFDTCERIEYTIDIYQEPHHTPTSFSLPGPSPSLSSSGSSRDDTSTSPLSPTVSESDSWKDAAVRIHPTPRYSHCIDNIISYKSLTSLPSKSVCSVYRDGQQDSAHEETTDVVISRSDDDQFLYTSILIPNFWKVIVDSPNPTEYTIFQDIVEVGSDSANSTIYSAVYRFKFSSPPTPPTPPSLQLTLPPGPSLSFDVSSWAEASFSDCFASPYESPLSTTSSVFSDASFASGVHTPSYEMESDPFATAFTNFMDLEGGDLHDVTPAVLSYPSYTYLKDTPSFLDTINNITSQ